MAKEMNFEALNAALALLDKKANIANEQAKAAGTYAPGMEKINELLSDEAFCGNLLQAEDAQQAKALFAENGVEISEEGVNKLGEYIALISNKLIENGGELSEEDLEDVAGGVVPIAAAGYSFIEGASMISTGVFSTGSIGSAASAGAAAGTAGFPVVGTIIGAVVAAAVVSGIIYRKEIAAGAKKLGKWIKSWF